VSVSLLQDGVTVTLSVVTRQGLTWRRRVPTVTV